MLLVLFTDFRDLIVALFDKILDVYKSTTSLTQNAYFEFSAIKAIQNHHIEFIGWASYAHARRPWSVLNF